MMHAWLFFYHLNHKAGLHQDRVERGAGPKHRCISEVSSLRAALLNTPSGFIFYRGGGGEIYNHTLLPTYWSSATI